MYPRVTLGSLEVPTYFVFLSLLYCGLAYLIYRRAKNEQLPAHTALDLYGLIMIFGFLGARFFHVLFEAPGVYIEAPHLILHFWLGGFVFYGGAIAAFLAGLFFIRFKKLDWRQWADFAAPIAALGYGLGRIACFLAGCCYGKSCDLYWAINHRHPTQLYAVVWELSLFAFLLFAKSRKLGPAGFPGGLFFLWIGGHGLGRIVMEIFRADDRGPLWMGLAISGWLSLVLLAMAAWGLMRLRKNRQ